MISLIVHGTSSYWTYFAQRGLEYVHSASRTTKCEFGESVHCLILCVNVTQYTFYQIRPPFALNSFSSSQHWFLKMFEIFCSFSTGLHPIICQLHSLRFYRMPKVTESDQVTGEFIEVNWTPNAVHETTIMPRVAFRKLPNDVNIICASTVLCSAHLPCGVQEVFLVKMEMHYTL